MAYAEWIAVKVVVSKSIGTVGIRNATLQWGKFYRYTNKDDEISTEEVSSMNVQAGSPQWIASAPTNAFQVCTKPRFAGFVSINATRHSPSKHVSLITRSFASKPPHKSRTSK